MAGETVTVACKLPNGLVLRLFRPKEMSVPILGGGFRSETQFVDTGESLTLNGWAHRQNMAPQVQIIGQNGGYALTHEVPKAFWDKWLEQNKDSDFVKNGIIFAHEKAGFVESQAKDKDHANLRSGFERLDPSQMPKGIERIPVAQ